MIVGRSDSDRCIELGRAEANHMFGEDRGTSPNGRRLETEKQVLTSVKTLLLNVVVLLSGQPWAGFENVWVTGWKPMLLCAARDGCATGPSNCGRGIGIGLLRKRVRGGFSGRRPGRRWFSKPSETEQVVAQSGLCDWCFLSGRLDEPIGGDCATPKNSASEWSTRRGSLRVDFDFLGVRITPEPNWTHNKALRGARFHRCRSKKHAWID